jgi:anaerobic selenocysteine-containing dehydrogenase
VEKAAKPSEQYPYYLLVRRLPGMKHSAPLTSNNPYILDAFPEPFVEINSATAKKLKISDGDRVELKSAMGAVQIKALVNERIRPDCLMYLHNFGHTVPELSLSKGDTSDGNLVPDRPRAKGKDMDWSACAWMSDVCVGVQKV